MNFAPRCTPDFSPLGTLPGWLSALLRARGVDTEEKADHFLNPSLKDLHDRDHPDYHRGAVHHGCRVHPGVRAADHRGHPVRRLQRQHDQRICVGVPGGKASDAEGCEGLRNDIWRGAVRSSPSRFSLELGVWSLELGRGGAGWSDLSSEGRRI